MVSTSVADRIEQQRASIESARSRVSDSSEAIALHEVAAAINNLALVQNTARRTGFWTR